MLTIVLCCPCNYLSIVRLTLRVRCKTSLDDHLCVWEMTSIRIHLNQRIGKAEITREKTLLSRRYEPKSFRLKYSSLGITYRDLHLLQLIWSQAKSPRASTANIVGLQGLLLKLCAYRTLTGLTQNHFQRVSGKSRSIKCHQGWVELDWKSPRVFTSYSRRALNGRPGVKNLPFRCIKMHLTNLDWRRGPAFFCSLKWFLCFQL